MPILLQLKDAGEDVTLVTADRRTIRVRKAELTQAD
jgi:hypothetical protein